MMNVEPIACQSVNKPLIISSVLVYAVNGPQCRDGFKLLKKQLIEMGAVLI